jgi:phage/plasmid primase-like uncharacterized protein
MLNEYGDFEELSSWNLDSRSYEIKCFDKEDKGKTFYIGNIDSGFPVVTVSSHAHGTHTICSYPRHAHIDVKSEFPKRTEAQRKKEERKRIEAKRKLELENRKKAANLKKEIASFSKLKKNGKSEYLKAKNISEFVDGVRYGKDKHGTYAAIMLISGHPDKFGQPAGLQKFYDKPFLNKDGASISKQFTWGLKKRDDLAHHFIGKIEDDTKKIVVCEGFADGVVINQAKKFPVLVALDAFNVKRIATIYADKYSGVELIYAADNDNSKYDRTNNIGIIVATESAQKTGGKVAITPDDKDFSDLYNRILSKSNSNEALDQVITKINRAKKPTTGFQWALEKIGLTGLKKVKTGVQFGELNELKKVIARACSLGSFKVPFKSRKSLNKTIIGAIDGIQKRLTESQHSRLINYSKRLEEGIWAKSMNKLIAQKSLNDNDLSGCQAEEMNEKLIPEYVLTQICNKTPGISVIKSIHGTGKTSLIAKGLVEYARKNRIQFSYIAHRISLTRDAARKLDIEHYQSFNSSAKTAAICVNSIINKQFQEFFNQKDTICVIDEIAQVYRHIATGTVSKPEKVFELLQKFIANNIVIAMDADIDAYTISLLKQAGIPIKVYTNTFKAGTEQELTIFNSQDKLTDKIFNALKEGKKIVMPCDNKAIVQGVVKKIHDELPAVKVLEITADNTGESDVKEILDDITLLKKYDFLAFSPALGSGVSIEFEHFDECYANFDGNITPNDGWQMLRRVRPLKHYNVFLSAKTQELPIDFNSVATEYIKAQETTFNFIKGADGKYHSDLVLNDYDEMAIKRRCLDNEQRNDFANTFIRTGILDGVSVNYFESAENTRKNTAQMVKDSKEENASKVAEAVCTNSSLKSLLEKQSERTKHETHQLNHYDVWNELCLKEVTADDVLFYNGGGIEKVRLLDNGLAAWEDCMESDRSDVDKNKPISKRLNYTLRHNFIRLVFENVGIEIKTEIGDGSCDPKQNYRFENSLVGIRDVWFSSQSLKDNGFVTYIKEYAAEFNGCKWGKIPKNFETQPAHFVKSFLGKMGLSITAPKNLDRIRKYHITIDEKALYILDIAEKRVKNNQNTIIKCTKK